MLVLIFTNKLKFPSPYGVSFILMHFKGGFKMIKFKSGFPSPYRVSFIPICIYWYYQWNYKFLCFRLLTEYHSFLFTKETALMKFLMNTFPSPYGVSFILIINFYQDIENDKIIIVSVSLRSIIHSYKK